MKKARVEANGISLGRYDFSWDNEGMVEQMTGKIYAGQYASRFLALIGKSVKLVEPAGVVNYASSKAGADAVVSALSAPAADCTNYSVHNARSR